MKKKNKEVLYGKKQFKNALTNETIEVWFGREIREIEGKPFWVTYNTRGTLQLLAKDSWTLLNQKT